MMDRIPREWRRDRIRDRMAGLPCLPSVPSMMPIVFGGDVGLSVIVVADGNGDKLLSCTVDVDELDDG